MSGLAVSSVGQRSAGVQPSMSSVQLLQSLSLPSQSSGALTIAPWQGPQWGAERSMQRCRPSVQPPTPRVAGAPVKQRCTSP